MQKRLYAPVNPLPIILSGKSAWEGAGQAVVFVFLRNMCAACRIRIREAVKR